MAADWIQSEFLLRAVALLAVRAAVECHRLVGVQPLAASEYYQSNDPVLSAMLSDRMARQVCIKPIACFTTNALVDATENWNQRRCLGSGGFGAVFRGRIQSNGTDVAIKGLFCAAEDIAHMSELHHEVTMSGAHDSLVTLEGYCGGIPAIVFELMEGGTLQRAI